MVKQREVVVITGASAGVGRATAREFARRGARVGLLARGTEGLDAAQRDVESLGGTAIALSVDVAHAEQVEAAAATIEADFGPITTWINNAMVSVFSPGVEMTADEYRRVTEVTYLGTVHGTLSALRRMRARNRGTIIQVGSALAYRGIPLQSAYCAAKHAVQGFTESIRCELMHDACRVRLTMVQLPALNTPQFGWVKSRLPRKPQPVPPIYQPEVAARAIVWASEHDRRELNVALPTMVTIAGNKIAPGLGDWYLAKTGFDAQQTDEAAESGRRDNLWEPIPGDHGAHGSFTDRAFRTSPMLWASTHRGMLFSIAGGLAAAVLARREWTATATCR